MIAIGRALRRMRRLRGMKQSHLAELLGVTQATVSRWEGGTHRPAPEQEARIAELLAAPLDPGADWALRGLVERSVLPVHAICDATHRLLAASPARESDWGRTAGELRGQSLWRYATADVEAAEARLPDVGWYDGAASAVASRTAGNRDADLRIVPQVYVWERLVLADGTVVRLDTAVPGGDPKRLRPDAVVLAAPE